MRAQPPFVAAKLAIKLLCQDAHLPLGLSLELLARQTLIALDILGAGLFDYIVGQHKRVYFFQQFIFGFKILGVCPAYRR